MRGILELIGGPQDGECYWWHCDERAFWDATIRHYVLENIRSTCNVESITVERITRG